VFKALELARERIPTSPIIRAPIIASSRSRDFREARIRPRRTFLSLLYVYAIHKKMRAEFSSSISKTEEKREK